MATHKLVAGDRNPPLIVQLADENTGEWVDLTSDALTVKCRFRERGATTTLWEATLTKVTGGEAVGQAQLDWPSEALDDLYGGYEMEIYIEDSESKTETCYKTLKFHIREAFADAS